MQLNNSAQKKLLVSGIIFLSFLFLAFFPLIGEKPEKGELLPFNVSCKTLEYIKPTSFLVWSLEHNRHDKNIEPEALACTMDALIGRESFSALDIIVLRLMNTSNVSIKRSYILASSLVSSGTRELLRLDRPDLAAYFLDRLFKMGRSSVATDLGKLYAEGRGVPRDEEKAKYIFRSYISISFPSSQSGDECSKKFEEKYIYHSLYAEQLRWFQELCYKNPEELYQIAEWYLDQNNPYKNVKIAKAILWNLREAHKYQKAKKLLSQMHRDEHPILPIESDRLKEIAGVLALNEPRRDRSRFKALSVSPPGFIMPSSFKPFSRWKLRIDVSNARSMTPSSVSPS